jgi:hypothetical protein
MIQCVPRTTLQFHDPECPIICVTSCRIGKYVHSRYGGHLLAMTQGYDVFGYAMLDFPGRLRPVSTNWFLFSWGEELSHFTSWFRNWKTSPGIGLDTTGFQFLKFSFWTGNIKIFTLKKKLHGLSPRANYTDRETAACRRSNYQLLRIEGATWSAWLIPMAVFSVF